jgi:AraC-like DNA-binding protein
MNGTLAVGDLDIVAVLRRLEHYCRATGTQGFLIDDEGTVLGVVDELGETRPPSSPLDGCCPVCALLGEEESREELRAQLYGAYQAERFGGKYIQMCAHSLIYWIAPISMDGFLRLAYVGGPLLVLDPADAVADLVASGRLTGDLEAKAKSVLEGVPRALPRRVTSLAEILADAAAATAAPSSGQMESILLHDEQQSRISEYIQDLKAERETEVPFYPIQKERELLNAISRANKTDSQRLLNEILGHIFFSSGHNPAVIRVRALELVVLISRAALDGGADMESIFDLGFTYLNQIQKMRSVDDIAYWLSRVMVRFSDLVFNLSDVKHADVMMKAMRYIGARFTGPLTLDEVAAAVSLSPTYFSKIWNEEMRCRFTAYLNKLRIERGKILLRSSETPLIDIAGLLGYEDQSYFTKVFKKLVGQSPGRFREAAGRGGERSSQEIHDDEGTTVDKKS